MAVRAKFKCRSNNNGVVIMDPVYSADPNHENKAFWDATPGGTIALTITNPEAKDQFEAGKEYYVDFTPAEVDRQHAFENAPKEKQEITQNDVGRAEDVLDDFL